MKRIGFTIEACLAVLMMLAACGTVYPDNLISADNNIAFISGNSVEVIATGTTYGDIVTKLGATRDDGMGDGTHTAVIWWTATVSYTCRSRTLRTSAPRLGRSCLPVLRARWESVAR